MIIQILNKEIKWRKNNLDLFNKICPSYLNRFGEAGFKSTFKFPLKHNWFEEVGSGQLGFLAPQTKRKSNAWNYVGQFLIEYEYDMVKEQLVTEFHQDRLY